MILYLKGSAKRGRDLKIDDELLWECEKEGIERLQGCLGVC